METDEGTYKLFCTAKQCNFYEMQYNLKVLPRKIDDFQSLISNSYLLKIKHSAFLYKNGRLVLGEKNRDIFMGSSLLTTQILVTTETKVSFYWKSWSSETQRTILSL